MRACERRHRRTASEPRERQGMTDRREVIPWHISKLKDVFTSPAACLRCRIKCHSKAVQMPFEYHSGRDCKGLRRGSSESPSIPRHRSWKRRKRFWKRPPLSCPAFPSLQGDCGFFFSLCSIPPRVWFPRTGTIRAAIPAACGMNRPCRGTVASVRAGHKKEYGCRLYCRRHLSLSLRAIRLPLR